jgi:hypothetical protein
MKLSGAEIPGWIIAAPKESRQCLLVSASETPRFVDLSGSLGTFKKCSVQSMVRRQGLFMKRSTPPPRKNVLEALPELGECGKTTVRLHPRKGNVPGVDKSKLGGTILWPREESWPTCDEIGHIDNAKMDEPYPPGTAVGLVPVLQLRSDDFPEVEFFPGTDLLQVFWCPLDHDATTVVAKPFVYWRQQDKMRNPLPAIPESELASEWYRPNECRLLPERVVEYPNIGALTAEMQQKIDSWDISDVLDDIVDSPSTFYEWEASTCPGNKVGGYPHFIQGDATPRCKCGRLIEHLLTLTDYEFDAGTHYRWCPVEDKELWQSIQRKSAYDNRIEEIGQAPGFRGFGAGYQYIFICRSCDDWPIKSVFQR